jgi:hypothetical protein
VTVPLERRDDVFVETLCGRRELEEESAVLVIAAVAVFAGVEDDGIA